MPPPAPRRRPARRRPPTDRRPRSRLLPLLLILASLLLIVTGAHLFFPLVAIALLAPRLRRRGRPSRRR